jgi:hypothetical protein
MIGSTWSDCAAVVRANAAVVAPSNADTADIPAALGPRRTTVCVYAIVARLDVDSDDTGAT